MKPLIKSATIFKAAIPCDATTLHNHLAEKSFTEPLPSQLGSVGFVPIGDGCNLVTPFHGGYAFKMRFDEKIIPAAVLAKKTAERAARLQESTGRKPNKEERATLKEMVRDELAATAFARTTTATSYYHLESGLLIVASTSKRLTDMAVSMLIQAVGAIKTETLHVSSVKKGLTTKLKAWLGDNPDAFGTFHPCSDAALAGDDGRKVTVRMTSLELARQGLEEALGRGFSVTSLGFMARDGAEFRLTEDFKLKGITYGHAAPEDDDVFVAEATLEVASLVGITQELVALLEYKEDEDAPALPGDDETTPN